MARVTKHPVLASIKISTSALPKVDSICRDAVAADACRAVVRRRLERRIQTPQRGRRDANELGPSLPSPPREEKAGRSACWAQPVRAVAQIFNLLYRQFAIGRACKSPAPAALAAVRRIQFC